MARPRKKPSKTPRKTTYRTTTRKVQQGENDKAPIPVVPVKPEIDDGPWDEAGLTEKQKRFVYFFVGQAGGNATQAARLAGYRDDNYDALRATAFENLTKPHVQRAIARERARRFGSMEDVKAGIAEIANGNAADFLKPDASGNLHLSLEQMAQAGALGLLQQVQEERIEAGGNVATVRLKLKLYDRLKALEVLAKINGQLREHIEHSGTLYTKVIEGVSDDDL